MNLEELIKGCCNQNRNAQAKVYQLFAGKLFGISLKYSKNKEDAEDILQESFITIFKRIKQYKGNGSFEGWIKRIVINTALQKFREKSHLRLINEEITEDEVVYLENDDINLDDLLSIIQKLPERYRLVFNLYVLDGFSHKEIASMMEISEGTSKSNLSRARKILKNKIQVYQLAKA